VETKRNVEFEIKPVKQGAYVGKHLSFGLNGKVLEGNAIAANRTRYVKAALMLCRTHSPLYFKPFLLLDIT